MVAALPGLLRFSPEVKKALELGGKRSRLVLLESAVLTHGMPHPQNINLARKLEEIVRGRGAVPATVAVLSGRVHVGLSDDELQRLCVPPSSQRRSPLKVSRRDLSFAMAHGLDGGTTVAGTLAVASAVSLDDPPPVFATGGIGGVHRGGENSLDISADLIEMGRVCTAVVSAGVKSILDVGRTLELLETQGVSVAALAQDGDNAFPAFFARSSGHKAPHVVTSVDEAATLICSHRDLGLRSGILFAVPIPEDAAADGAEMEAAIQSSLVDADEEGVTGREVTPFVLRRVLELTGTKSLAANEALLQNNANVGAQIAVELASQSEKRFHFGEQMSSSFSSSKSRKKRRPSVIGGSIFDLVTRLKEPIRGDGATHKGSLHFGYGGVARNIAEALACLDVNPYFLSAVGMDDPGKSILGHNQKLDKSSVQIFGDVPTATYSILLDPTGEVEVGVGDMSIHAKIDESTIDTVWQRDIRGDTALVILDGNLTERCLDHILKKCRESKLPVFYEPTAVDKAVKILSSRYLSSVTYVSPNLSELQSMTGRTLTDPSDLHACAELCCSLLSSVQVVLLTMGAEGVMVAKRGKRDEPLPLAQPSEGASTDVTVSAVHYPAVKVHDIVSVSGAGDCFVAGFIAAALRGCSQDTAVSVGMQAATLSISSVKSVPLDMNVASIDWRKRAVGAVIF